MSRNFEKWFDLIPPMTIMFVVIFLLGPVMGAYTEAIMGPVQGWMIFALIEGPAVFITISIIISTHRDL